MLTYVFMSCGSKGEDGEKRRRGGDITSCFGGLGDCIAGVCECVGGCGGCGCSC